MRPCLVVHAEGSPQTKHVVTKEGGEEVSFMVFVVPPISGDDFTDRLPVNAIAEKRPALEKQEESCRERVRSIVLGLAQCLCEGIDGVMGEVLTIS